MITLNMNISPEIYNLHCQIAFRGDKVDCHCTDKVKIIFSKCRNHFPKDEKELKKNQGLAHLKNFPKDEK